MWQLASGNMEQAQLGLGHSYSRCKVKFNPGREDNMIIQAIALLDQLDKDVNTFAMRVREWYSYHFPELIKLVKDNYTFAKCAEYIGDRTVSARPPPRARLLASRAPARTSPHTSSCLLSSLSARLYFFFYKIDAERGASAGFGRHHDGRGRGRFGAQGFAVVHGDGLQRGRHGEHHVLHKADGEAGRVPPPAR
jgi:hypothetical protein